MVRRLFSGPRAPVHAAGVPATAEYGDAGCHRACRRAHGVDAEEAPGMGDSRGGRGRQKAQSGGHVPCGNTVAGFSWRRISGD